MDDDDGVGLYVLLTGLLLGDTETPVPPPGPTTTPPPR